MYHPLTPIDKLTLAVAGCFIVATASADTSTVAQANMPTAAAIPAGAPGGNATSVTTSPTILSRPITMLPLAPVGAVLSPDQGGPAQPMPQPKPVVKKHVRPKHKQDSTEVKAAVSAPDPYLGINLVPVSSDAINRFQFSSAVKQLLFPADVPATKPLYVAGNKEVLVSFGPGMPDVAQMVAVLENGSVITLYLKPRPGPGAIVHASGSGQSSTQPAQPATDVSGGAAPTLTDAERVSRGAADKNPALAALALMKQVELGNLPADYESVTPPALVAMDKFTVAPIAAWTDHATYTVYAYQLIAAKGQAAEVSPPEFYRPGVLAVDVTGDKVDADNSPYLYVVEAYVDAEH